MEFSNEVEKRLIVVVVGLREYSVLYIVGVVFYLRDLLVLREASIILFSLGIM